MVSVASIFLFVWIVLSGIVFLCDIGINTRYDVLAVKGIDLLHGFHNNTYNLDYLVVVQAVCGFLCFWC